MSLSSKSAEASEQATIFQIVLDNDISNCVKHKLDVGRIRSTGEVSVDLLQMTLGVPASEIIIIN